MWAYVKSHWVAWMFAAIFGLVGCFVYKLIEVSVARWMDNPKLAVEIGSLRLEAPDDPIVFLPADPDLKPLIEELPAWYMLHNPQVFASLLVPPSGAGPFGLSVPGPGGFFTPPQVSRVGVQQLQELYELHNMPQADRLAFADQLEKVYKLPNSAPEQLKADLQERLAELRNPKSLEDMKKKISSRAEALRSSSGYLVTDVFVVNSGGRTISLLFPAELHWASPDQKNKQDYQTDGVLELRSQSSEHAVSVGPNESKTVTLVSSRADNEWGKDIHRKAVQDGWTTGSCWVVFTTSDRSTISSRSGDKGLTPFKPQ